MTRGAAGTPFQPAGPGLKSQAATRACPEDSCLTSGRGPPRICQAEGLSWDDRRLGQVMSKLHTENGAQKGEGLVAE